MKKSRLLGALSACVALLSPYSIANSASLSLGDIIAQNGSKVIAYRPSNGTSTTIINNWANQIAPNTSLNLMEVVGSHTIYAIVSRFNQNLHTKACTAP